jgi:hypothetical protein
MVSEVDTMDSVRRAGDDDRRPHHDIEPPPAAGRAHPTTGPIAGLPRE